MRSTDRVPVCGSCSVNGPFVYLGDPELVPFVPENSTVLMRF